MLCDFLNDRNENGIMIKLSIITVTEIVFIITIIVTGIKCRENM